jgi:hypothetical protein
MLLYENYTLRQGAFPEDFVTELINWILEVGHHAVDDRFVGSLARIVVRKKILEQVEVLV